MGGGWGHITRALSLGRIAVANHQIAILTNSPYLDYLPNNCCQIHSISKETDFQTTCDRVQQVIQENDYSRLIIDTFPRGLGGELVSIIPLIKVPLILIHRDLNAQYVQSKNLHHFVSHFFDLVLVPGEGEELPLVNLPQVQHTNPWLIKKAEELPNLATAYSLLKLNEVESQAKIVIVLASGRPEELSIYGQLTYHLAENDNCVVRCLSPILPDNCPPNLWVFHAPALDCLWIADLVVGGGGYNTVYECQALGVPLVVLPFQRLYDRQLARVKRLQKMPKSLITVVNNIEQASASIDHLLKTTLPKSPKSPPLFLNGAVSAVQKIENLSTIF